MGVEPTETIIQWRGNDQNRTISELHNYVSFLKFVLEVHGIHGTRRDKNPPRGAGLWCFTGVPMGRLHHFTAVPIIPFLRDGGDGIDGCSQRFQFKVSVALVHFGGSVARELHADFLSNPGIRHG